MNEFPLRVIFLDRLARLFPRLFWQNYSTIARRQGFDRLHLVLSFDCDTPEDAEAAAKIHERLTQLNIKAAYAVPGVQLEQNTPIYQELARQGAEFINHGARPHTIWQGDYYQSSAFYNHMTRTEVVEDIQKGHEIVTRVIGTQPRGFRGPHFGRFQRPENLALIYDTIRNMDYTFATTTVPEFGFRHGPAHDHNGLFEFPLSGSSMSPISLLDSYTYLRNLNDRTVTDEYGNLLRTTLETLTRWHIVGLINIYVDPSHVEKSNGFFDGLEISRQLGIPSNNYADVVAMLSDKKEHNQTRK